MVWCELAALLLRELFQIYNNASNVPGKFTILRSIGSKTLGRGPHKQGFWSFKTLDVTENPRRLTGSVWVKGGQKVLVYRGLSFHPDPLLSCHSRRPAVTPPGPPPDPPSKLLQPHTGVRHSVDRLTRTGSHLCKSKKLCNVPSSGKSGYRSILKDQFLNVGIPQ